MFKLAASMNLLELASHFTRTGLYICLLLQMLMLVVGYFTKSSNLQRFPIAMTSGFAAFTVATFSTTSMFIWCAMFGTAFFSTYFLMPSFVGEDKKEESQDSALEN